MPKIGQIPAETKSRGLTAVTTDSAPTAIGKYPGPKKHRPTCKT